MADPLSIAASIAGVISLADIVFIRTRKYLTSAKNADKEVKDLSQEVLLLSGALHSLSKLAQALDADGLRDQHIDNLRMHHIAACHATLDEVAKKLKKLADNATRRKVVWPFVSDRTAELLAEISRHRENVNLALTAGSMGTLLQVLSKTEEVHGNTERLLEEAKKTQKIVTRIHQDLGRKDILNYFLPYNPQQNYEMSLSLRHPRTGLWLTRKPEFQTWLERPDSALWLSGIPGAGKTVLAGTIIEEALNKSSEDIATAFFFCDYKDVKTQTADNVLSGLASQLAIQKEEAYGLLDHYYRDLHPENALERLPTVPGLKRVLKDMIKAFDQVYLIVDGLDECGDNTDDVVDGILDIVDCSDNISTALLSRDEYNIRDRLEDDFTELEIAAHTEDITEYVTSEIEKRISNKSLRISDLGLKIEILERLIEGAKGMFRWVACQLDSLRDCMSDKECRAALGQLPPGLNESYARVLQRVPMGKERIMQMILNFIAYAEPKLDVPILREALSVPEKLGSNDVLNTQSIIREDSIARLCRSLVRKSNDGYYFEFAHFSVQEFLEGEMQSLPEFKTFKMSKSICQLLLTKQCLKYLLLRNFSSLPTTGPGLQEHINLRLRQHPFYFYAAICWPIFAISLWTDETLVELASLLFHSKKTGNFVSWALELTRFLAIQCYRPRQNSFKIISRRTALKDYEVQTSLDLLPQLVDRTFTTLHMASTMSLSMICSTLIDQGLNIDQQSPFGCPLQCAIQGPLLTGQVEYFGISTHAAQPYAGVSYWNTQTDAAEFGRENTIMLLWRAGATHPTACSSPFEGVSLVTLAWQVALWVENVSAIGILLESGCELEEEDLSQFSRFRENLGKLGLFKDDHDTHRLESLILRLGPMIGRSPAHFRLCQAAWSLAVDLGCEFVRDPSIVDTRISLSLEALRRTIFASIDYTDIKTLAEALKDPRADIRGLSDDYGTTIFKKWLMQCEGPVDSDQLTVLRMLVSAGMDVTQPNHEGLLPIHELAQLREGRYDGSCYDALGDVVSEFARRGTGCTARSRANQNVLHLGLWSIIFIKAVLEAEADDDILTALKTQDESGFTPIARALEAGQEEVALILLDRSHYDPKTLKGRASIHAICVAGGTHRAFNALLDAGITLDNTERGKTTLLCHVGPKTSKDFVLQLTRMSPNELRLRVDARLPLDAYLENCITSDIAVLDSDVLHLLAKPGSEELDQRDKQQVWEDFTHSIRNARRLKKTNNWPNEINEIVEENTANASASLLQLGFFRSYEEVTHDPGILPLLASLRGGLDDLWPLSLETICEILEQAIHWRPLRESDEILRLLKVAVKLSDVELVGLLLENGVSVHRRIDETSALEVACLESNESSDSRYVFTLLLECADTSRLDEINPHRSQGKGLIHYLAGPRKQWQLKELLNRGVDVNLRTSTHDGAVPAIVHHLLQGSSDSAFVLLARRADPTMINACRMDAALAAAFANDLSFLLHLHTSRSQSWQLNWQRSWTATLKRGKSIKLQISEANALHLAAWNGHCDVLRFYFDDDLLTNPNAVSTELLTPMHLAAFAGKVDAIKLLYSRGGDLDSKSADGSLPLHLAVRNEHTEVVKFLVENGSAMDLDIRGLSPVGYAMQLHNQSLLDCLQTTRQYLDYQYEPGRRKKDLVYAFEQALIRGDVKECELLRGLGCPVNADLPGQKGRTALILALENSNEELTRWLLAHDAEVYKKCSTRSGWISALHAMAMRPALSSVLPLLLQIYQSQGGSVTTEAPSPICIAIQYNNNIGLKHLLDHVAKHEIMNSATGDSGRFGRSASPVNSHRLYGGAPLHWAAGQGNCEAIKLLLDHGADVDVLDNQQKTPLQMALKSEPSQGCPAAKLLLCHGAALEIRNNSGETAVMVASRRGKTDLIRLLDDAGADLMAVDFNSWDCLHLAAHWGHLELFVWLASRGLQLHAKNSQGWSAIQCAFFQEAFSSFLLNIDRAFDNIEAITYANVGNVMSSGPACLTRHFNMYSRRLGLERLRAFTNLEPTNSWSPLCMSASIGQILAVTNILRLGADVDFEGSPYGSALMAACSSGRLESVRILVRHGAAISYLGNDGIRSAVDAASNHQTILSWLLVNRFTEQRKLSEPASADSAAHHAEHAKPWSGPVKKELTITGTAERQVHESARGYWSRLMAVKRGWQGKVVNQNKLAQTHRPSRLIPDEPVRVCPGDYGTSKQLK